MSPLWPTVMSVDHDCSPEITAMVGASIALSISDIPWNGPIAGVSVGLVDGEIRAEPHRGAARGTATCPLTLAASEEKIVMIEAGANEVDEETMMKAITRRSRRDQEDAGLHQRHRGRDRQAQE